MKEFVITKNEAGQRFDKYLKKLLCNAAGSFIYKMLRKKNIVLNDKKADGSENLKEYDHVKLFFSEETFEKFTKSPQKTDRWEHLPKIDEKHLPFEVLWETEDVLVINKPSGMLSQKAKKEDISANEYILSYLLSTGAVKKQELQTFCPSICNRLDRNTSGILIAGKTLKGLQDISQKLKSRSLEKYYMALVAGRVEEACHLKGYLRKEEKTNRVFVSNNKGSNENILGEEKWIETEYIPIQILKDATLLKVHLITGRSHQIRAHLSSIGHPIIGDPKYGNRKINDKYKRDYHITSQLLHAALLIWEDGMKIEAPLPKDFSKLCK